MAVTDNAPMAHKQARPDTTPRGNLSEAQLKSVIGYQMAQASVATSRIYDAAVGRKTGLHRLEYTILMLVRENTGCTASSLAKALDISTPNMALWLDRVTGKGLVDRVPSATDRRSNHLRLTPHGEQIVVGATLAILKTEEAMLSRLSFGERVLLAELLHKVAGCRDTIDAAEPD
ncbi:MarR family transcriptional regulator [Variovorax sp. J22G21]|uniref:MarR family winged helix-turn-helix transcriptional regulator n=1 Tax=Variovorax fucosicus TaxID=3053517 RepID=UPI0025753A74|nr:MULTISPECIES: MarR family transcriptional regulator [unclassified Variovorax]MDM0041578.1 MarR family transcriptional regulator [Variovorax sp. J22R193]MDM0057937.1 MarR family transcriptional regulator [Variovorax sp. J22G47]MDM0060634.1 MarR family transcriptional regulator [Variovorax sp. J22G21]